MELPIEDVLAAYGREIAALTHRAVIAEAQVAKLLAEQAEPADPEPPEK